MINTKLILPTCGRGDRCNYRHTRVFLDSLIKFGSPNLLYILQMFYFLTMVGDMNVILLLLFQSYTFLYL